MAIYERMTVKGKGGSVQTYTPQQGATVPGSGATARFDSAGYRIMGAADTAAINAANNLGKTARTGIMQFENAYLDFSKTKATELMNEYRSQMKHALSGEDGILSKLGEQASTAGQDTLDVSSKIQGELLKDYGKDSIVGNIFNSLVHDAENDFHVTAVDHQQKQVKWWKDTTDDKAMTLASEDAGNNYANEEKRTEKVAEAGFYARQKFARNGYSGLALDEAVREVESKAWYGVAKRAMDAGDITTAYAIHDQCSVSHRRQGPHDLTKIDGMIEGANVDLNNRKVLRTNDSDGNDVIKTVQSMTVEFDGQHVVLPTIIDGKEYTPDQAFEHYRKTGEHLGKFKTKDAAEEYSQKLHENHAVEYGPGATYMTGDDLSKLRKELETAGLKVLGDRIERGDMVGAETLGRTIKQGGVYGADMSASFSEMTSRFSGKTGYLMGGRNPESGKVDCSGWCGYLLEKAGLDGFRGKNAEGLVTHSWNVGRRVDDNELFSNPKEGLVIGLDQGPKAHDRGRALGIDHVVVTYKDPSTGRIMVSESSGSKGVHATPVEDWLSYHQKRGHKFFTGDVSGVKPRSAERAASPELAAKVDGLIMQGNARTQAAQLVSSVITSDDPASVANAQSKIMAISDVKLRNTLMSEFNSQLTVQKHQAVATSAADGAKMILEAPEAQRDMIKGQYILNVPPAIRGDVESMINADIRRHDEAELGAVSSEVNDFLPSLKDVKTIAEKRLIVERSNLSRKAKDYLNKEFDTEAKTERNPEGVDSMVKRINRGDFINEADMAVKMDKEKITFNKDDMELLKAHMKVYLSRNKEDNAQVKALKKATFDAFMISDNVGGASEGRKIKDNVELHMLKKELQYIKETGYPMPIDQYEAELFSSVANEVTNHGILFDDKKPVYEAIKDIPADKIQDARMDAARDLGKPTWKVTDQETVAFYYRLDNVRKRNSEKTEQKEVKVPELLGL